MKKALLLTVGLIFIIGNIYLFLEKPAPDKYLETGFPSGNPVSWITIGNSDIKVELADTDAKRIMGLSGRKNLKEGTGMLFVFESPGLHGIWMKDMKFPIDIVWIDAQKTVIWVEKSVSPETFPQVFYPPSDDLYVLELPSGTLAKNSVDIGKSMYLK